MLRNIIDVATAELMIPNSSVLLLTPTYTNAKILFNAVIKNIKHLGIKIVSQNINQFTFVLENGAMFTATSQKTLKNVLGSRISMLIVDEAQSIEGLIELYQQYIEPAMADYGVQENGVPYAKSVFIGTPRGVGTEFHELYLYTNSRENWASFNFPSTSNPLLSKAFIEGKRKSLPSVVFQEEYEGKWIASVNNAVYFAFDMELNTFDMSSIGKFMNEHSRYLVAIDAGFQDSTGHLEAWEADNGDVYIVAAYSQNQRTTEEHVTAFREQEELFPNTPSIRYIDPSAAQTAYDLMQTHEYITTPAVNDVVEGIACVNTLFAPTPERPPRLYINKELHELIRQVTLMSWKDKKNKEVNRDSKGTHWDLALACLRYLVYSNHLQKGMGRIIAL